MRIPRPKCPICQADPIAVSLPRVQAVGEGKMATQRIQCREHKWHVLVYTQNVPAETVAKFTKAATEYAKKLLVLLLLLPVLANCGHEPIVTAPKRASPTVSPTSASTPVAATCVPTEYPQPHQPTICRYNGQVVPCSTFCGWVDYE